MPARVKADSTRLIHISTLCLSKLGRSTFRGISLKSVGWTVGVVDGADGVCERRTASNAAATDVSVAAFTVASTRALMEAGSIAAAGCVAADSKKASSLGVGDGDGVFVARFRSRAWGEGKR